MLLQTLPTDMTGIQVTTLRPDSQLPTDVPGINIFLYQVTPNTAFRNADLPTRRSDGTLVQRPQLALDLHYLFTFYGNDAELEPQRLLGSAASTFHTYPTLSSSEITQALANVQPFNAAPFLAPPFNVPPLQPDLALQAERVKITPVTLSLEDLSKLWSVFYQIPFSLTLAYLANVVLIERTDLSPQSGLPVQTTSVTAVPMSQPVPSRVTLQSNPTGPIVAGSTVVISGTGLRVSGVNVQFANDAALLPPSFVSDTQLIVTLPANLQAGPQGVQVIQTLALGPTSAAHIVSRSSTVAFVLRPSIVGAVTGSATAIQFVVSPAVGPGQTITLLLNEATQPPPLTPAAYLFTLDPLSALATNLTIPISGVIAGITYFVRVQIDGAESPLDLTVGDPGFGPLVSL
jgi:hypothetical protein